MLYLSKASKKKIIIYFITIAITSGGSFLLIYNSFFAEEENPRRSSEAIVNQEEEMPAKQSQSADKDISSKGKEKDDPQKKNEVIDLELLRSLKFEELKDNPYELGDYKVGKDDLFETPEKPEEKPKE